MGTSYPLAWFGARWLHVCGPHGPSQLVGCVVTWSWFALHYQQRIWKTAQFQLITHQSAWRLLCNFHCCLLGSSAKFAGKFNGMHSALLNSRQEGTSFLFSLFGSICYHNIVNIFFKPFLEQSSVRHLSGVALGPDLDFLTASPSKNCFSCPRAMRLAQTRISRK